MPLQQTGTGFTNLQQLLNANNSNNLSDTISNGITNAADQAKNSLDQGVQGFTSSVAQNTLGDADAANRQSILNNVLGNYTSSSSAGNNVNTDPLSDVHIINPANTSSASTNTVGTSTSSASTNPYTSSQDLTDFQKYNSGAYNGPTSINNIGQIGNQAQNAQNLGQAVGSDAGRMGLLQQFVGGPQYTYGQQLLDNLLINNQGDLKNARRSTVGLVNDVNNASNSAGSQAAQAANTNQAFASQTGNLLNQGNQNIVNSLGYQANTTNANDAAEYQTLLNALGANNAANASLITPQLGKGAIGTTPNVSMFGQSLGNTQSGLTAAQAQALGLSKGEQTYGANLTGDLGMAAPATAGTIMSQDDVARLNALAQLQGLGSTNAIDTSNAGTYGGIQFNQGNANTGISQNATAYNNLINQAVTPNSGDLPSNVPLGAPSGQTNQQYITNLINQNAKDTTNQANYNRGNGATDPFAGWNLGNVISQYGNPSVIANSATYNPNDPTDMKYALNDTSSNQSLTNLLTLLNRGYNRTI